MAARRTALIFGVSGQDGAYLAQLLLDKGYEVHGTSRDRDMASFANLKRLGIFERVALHSAVTSDFRSVIQVLGKVGPDEIYNVASVSSARLSFEQPVETLRSTTDGTINILEAIRFLGLKTRFFNASSSECFGNTLDGPADETTALRPCSPYGVGKSAAQWLIANYREAYGLFACSGILFNHESPLRPARFVSRKIVRCAIDVAQGLAERVEFGNLSVYRDWGWAPEYVDAMWRMLAHDRAEDFVIATGVLSSLEDFMDAAFSTFGLDWRAHVVQGAAEHRPLDIHRSVGNPAKAERLLGWKARTLVPGIVDRLIDVELAERGLTRGALGAAPAGTGPAG